MHFAYGKGRRENVKVLDWYDILLLAVWCVKVLYSPYLPFKEQEAPGSGPSEKQKGGNGPTAQDTGALLN